MHCRQSLVPAMSYDCYRHGLASLVPGLRGCLPSLLCPRLVFLSFSVAGAKNMGFSTVAVLRLTLGNWASQDRGAGARHKTSCAPHTRSTKKCGRSHFSRERRPDSRARGSWPRRHSENERAITRTQAEGTAPVRARCCPLGPHS